MSVGTAFYAVAAIMIAAGVEMVLVGNIVRSALLAADVLAVGQLLVYVSAIMVLMLFALMLTPNQVDLPSGVGRTQPIGALLTALSVASISLGAVLGHAWNIRAVPPNVPTSELFGRLLMGPYVLPFWVASILLTVGFIGAIVIVRGDRRL